jgi:hypothetical protein
MNHAQRLRTLGALLADSQDYWRPSPFRIRQPAWCQQSPALAAAALALSDADCDALESDNAALWQWSAEHIADSAQFAELCALPGPTAAAPPDTGRHTWHVPGRKQAQIQAFGAAIGEPVAALVEWCAGKGHLGRHLGRQWPQPVLSLEIDAQLCASGRELARREALDQAFVRTAPGPRSPAH